jgi:hypothetical protein
MMRRRLLPDRTWGRDNISPRIVPEIEVHPSLSRPHHLTRERAVDGVYVPVGSTKRRASRAFKRATGKSPAAWRLQKAGR